MCIICELTAKGKTETPMANKLKGFLVDALDPSDFDGFSAEFVKEHELTVDPDVADKLFLGGIFTGMHASAEAMANTVKMHEGIMEAARTSMVALRAGVVDPRTFAAITPLLEALTQAAKEEAEQVFEFLIDNGKKVGVRASLIDGSEPLEGIADDEFRAIGQKSLDTVSEAGLGVIAQLTKMVAGGDTTNLGRTQVHDLRKRYARVNDHLTAVMHFRVSETKFMDKATGRVERHG